ncbi:putative C2 domain-containing protein [Helianthus annuus]|uniref:C2 domain-containing protein n=1 Tax=Helianthus annuus TaxID=4232 RepID=A0A251UL73_HELAN|nr:protein C2-DOMAIN ABA-RELATED 4 [Helianthus annuus]KAF5803705.1 putative C2 domain-containing protein [Helianthus annuus]KAJ0568342.1 putative C2 domain-containing protein [Helianthus annuus]KAJ0916745.1 putative C2 domain-containing protein [Helianthus annuus]
MDKVPGALRIKIKKGVRLAVRDCKTSDPYVVIKMGNQKVKTRIVERNVNPEWNEDLILSVHEPDLPIKLTVYDHDRFSKDDKMGDAEVDIKPFLEVLNMKRKNFPSGTILKKIQPTRSNFLVEQSQIIWKHDKIVQDMCLRLQHVECGEVDLELSWINPPGASST